MGEVCAWIQIGGHLDAAAIPQLAEAIAAAGLAIDFDHACLSVAEATDEIVLAATEGVALEFFTGEAVSDRFRGIEAAFTIDFLTQQCTSCIMLTFPTEPDLM